MFFNKIIYFFVKNSSVFVFLCFGSTQSIVISTDKSKMQLMKFLIALTAVTLLLFENVDARFGRSGGPYRSGFERVFANGCERVGQLLNQQCSESLRDCEACCEADLEHKKEIYKNRYNIRDFNLVLGTDECVCIFCT